MSARYCVNVDGKRVYSCSVRNPQKAQDMRDRYWPTGTLTLENVPNESVAKDFDAELCAQSITREVE